MNFGNDLSVMTIHENVAARGIPDSAEVERWVAHGILGRGLKIKRRLAESRQRRVICHFQASVLLDFLLLVAFAVHF